MRYADFHPLPLLPIAIAAVLFTADITLSATDLADQSTNGPTRGQKIDLSVPVGFPVKGIKIPQYDDQGKLTMNLTADTARKLDERQVEFGKLKVQFSDQEEKEIVVEIPHSILDMETKVLIADTPTLIHREDFEIVGEGAEFDTVVRCGKLKGHVHASFRNGTTIEQMP